MPTGYTEIIERPQGCTFREYALRCARGMGACVMQREDPLTDPPKYREPSDDDRKALKEATSRLKELLSMTPETARSLWLAEVEKTTARNAEYLADFEAKRIAYGQMRAEVALWQPPTPDHEGMKRFMLEQIDLCHRDDNEPYQAMVSPSPEAWLAGKIEYGQDRVERSAERMAEDERRCEDQRAWLDALLTSLPAAKAKEATNGDG